MPRNVSMADSTAIAANAQSLNVFANNAFVRAPFHGLVTLLATGSAVGLEMQLMVAGQLAVERQPMNTNNRVPIMPDDIVISDVEVREGQLIQLSVFNTTAGSLTPRTKIIIEEGELVY